MSMKEFECPSCGETIPADSLYCDMCGVELLECVNCGAVGTGNFCGECSGPMVSRRTASAPARAGRPCAGTSAVPAPESSDAHSTGKGGLPRLRYREGNVVIVPRDGAVIGRKEGEYAALLKDFDLISRRHGKFVRKGRTWFLVDLGSTNGCFVNDVELKPDEPVPFAKGEVVDIGT